MLPSVSADYNAGMSYLRNWRFVNPIDTFNTGATLSITQKLFEGGKSFIQRAIVKISTESVRKEALAEYFNVLDSVDNAYYAVLEATANLRAAESSLEASIASLSIAEIRQAGGMINLGDYLRALADKEARENSRNQARRNLSLYMTRFKSLIGVTETPALEEIDFSVYENLIRRLAGISDEEVDALYDEFLRIIIISNPSLTRSAFNIQRAERNLSLTRRDYFPTISLTIFSMGLNYSTERGFTSGSNGGISLRGSIPLDFWILNNRIARSKISLDSANLDYTGALNNLQSEVQSALLNTVAQAETVLSSRRSLEYTERHFEYVNQRYRLSQSSVSDLNEAVSLLITSQNNLTRSSYGFLQSVSKLNSLGAFENEERLIRILIGD
jgi:outer membrane protein